MRIGPLEIAQCDNDPERPENGLLTIELGTGDERHHPRPRTRRTRRGRCPTGLYNPPGRTALEYRVGTYGSFLAAMLDRLASPRTRPCAG
ncbi:hypothetical protein NKH77_40070 [Streptomyces sp. M19]